MEFNFFYGPDKIPFSMDDRKMVLSDSFVPFHGIISRGLLQKFEDKDIPGDTWYKYAHLIGSIPITDEDAALALLKEYAFGCEVLSFSDSAACARKYAWNYASGADTDSTLKCELWNIKEGHTSSVWKVSFLNENELACEEFIINVARDREAGYELRQTSEKMQAMADNFPDINIAGVYDITTVKLDYFDKDIAAVVTRNEFIPDAREIHALKQPGSTKEQYILVERFLTNENNPSQISSIRGRRFTETECDRIEKDIRFFSENAAREFDAEINILDGDLVWNGEKAIVVAIS